MGVQGEGGTQTLRFWSIWGPPATAPRCGMARLYFQVRKEGLEDLGKSLIHDRPLTANQRAQAFLQTKAPGPSNEAAGAGVALQRKSIQEGCNPPSLAQIITATQGLHLSLLRPPPTGHQSSPTAPITPRQRVPPGPSHCSEMSVRAAVEMPPAPTQGKRSDYSSKRARMRADGSRT